MGWSETGSEAPVCAANGTKLHQILSDTSTKIVRSASDPNTATEQPCAQPLNRFLVQSASFMQAT